MEGETECRHTTLTEEGNAVSKKVRPNGGPTPDNTIAARVKQRQRRNARPPRQLPIVTRARSPVRRQGERKAYSPLVSSAEKSTEPAEPGIHVVDSLTGHRPSLTGPRGSWKYLVKWVDSPPSWEPTRHIPRHFITQYCRKYELPLPPDIDDAEFG